MRISLLAEIGQNIAREFAKFSDWDGQVLGQYYAIEM